MMKSPSLLFGVVVSKQDVEASKVALLSSASALEKWIDMTGLNGQIKGL
jgi:hypothetical protein